MDTRKELIYGSLAGFSQVLTGHPLDTIKVRYINSNTNLWGCVKIMKREGIRSFYKGMTSPLTGNILINAQTFYFYNWVKREYKFNHFITGGLTGITLSFIETPTDLIKTRMQLDHTNMSYFKTIKQIGLRRIYTGFHITCWRNFIGVGGYFAGYELVKNNIENPYVGSFLGGMVAGFICWAPMYPLDNIKTQIQSDVNYSSAIIKIIKLNRGGLWKGFIPCIGRAIIVNPFVFFTYELSKEFI